MLSLTTLRKEPFENFVGKGACHRYDDVISGPYSPIVVSIFSVYIEAFEWKKKKNGRKIH